MANIFEPAKLSGYITSELKETEKIEYEGNYHKPAELIVEFIMSKGRPLIMGARMYNLSNRYIGWWPSFNVPRSVIDDWADRIMNDRLLYRPVFSGKGSGQDSLEHL